VELRHLILSGFVRTVDFHFTVKTVVKEEIVSHAYAVGLHGMPLAIVVVSDVAWKVKGRQLTWETKKRMNSLSLDFSEHFEFVTRKDAGLIEN
jgi:hypothetical protein